jgi:hypothetical protein
LVTRRFGSRFIPAKRPSRFSSRRISRPGRASAFPLLNIPATCLAKPPPQCRGVPRAPLLHPRRAERFRHFRLISCPRGFLFREAQAWLLTTVTASSVAACQPPHQKQPRALPKRDSGIDGSFPLPVALQEARRSRSPNVADDVAVMEGWVGKEGGAESLGTIRGILLRVPIGENLKPGPRGPMNHYDPLFPRLGFR